MKIVHAVRDANENYGVGRVVAELVRSHLAANIDAEVFSLEDIRPFFWPKQHSLSSKKRAKMLTALDVLWFSSVGSLYLWGKFSHRNDVCVISHNDSLFGDVYVNHGIFATARDRAERKRKSLSKSAFHNFLLIREEIRHRINPHKVVVSLNSDDVQDIQKIYSKSTAVHVEIPNGIPKRTELAASTQSPHLLSELPTGTKKILFVGHEFRRKGLDVAIEALSHLDDDHALIVVGGDADGIRNSEELAAHLGVEKRVFFFGFRRDVKKFYSACDLLVLPSLYEAAPMVLLESLGSGLPVVTTEGGFASRVIRAEYNGEISSRTGASFASAIAKVTRTHGVYTKDNCLNSVSGFDWDSIANKYVEVAQRVILLKQLSSRLTPNSKRPMPPPGKEVC